MIKNDLRKNPDYSEFVYFDLETDGTEVLDVGVLYRDDYTVFTLNDFVDFITSFSSGTFVAHYGSGFDFLFLVEPLLERGFSINYAVSGSNGIAMFVTKNKQVLRFIDSFRLASTSLSNFSQSFSPELTKLSIDCLPAELKIKDRELYYEYLRRDVVSLRNSYLGFMSQFSKYKLGVNPPLTAASLALKIFKNYLERPILTSTRKTREFERKSYFGGVCWLREPCSLEVNVYDINSMYPFIMRNSLFPVSYVGNWHNKFNDDYEGLWECQVEHEYPGIPFTFDCNTRKLAKSGTFILDRESILYLLENGCKVEVLRGYTYFYMDNIFHYYDELYSERLSAQQTGDVGKAYALKIVLNSLYGKFGQKDESRVIKSYSQPLELSLLRDGVPYNTDSRFIFYTEYREAKSAFPVIASLVTLRARLLLKKYADSVETVYCDTDSLHVPISCTMPVSTDLGGLKLEYTGRAVYIAKKLYCFLDSNKFVHKGVPKNHLTIDDYFGMLKGDRVRVDFTSQPTVTDVLGKGIKPGTVLAKHRTLGITPC